MKTTTYLLATSLISTLAFAGCKTSTNSGVHSTAGSAAASGVSANGDPVSTQILTGPVAAIAGPKRAIAVGHFDASGAFKSVYGDMDIGGGLGAMMVSALSESGRFIVMERANINQILAEQEMKTGGLSKGESAPEPGNLMGVQLMIYGSVTEFGASESGRGFSLGIAGLGGGSSGIGIGASPQWTKGKVTMDIRVVDTSTGQIVENYRVSRQAKSSAIDFGVAVKKVQLGHNSFQKTPLGQAARDAITEAVQKFSTVAAKRPWTGRVVELDGNDVIINAGRASGIEIGHGFKVCRITRKLTDPETNRVLGTRNADLGQLKVTSVEEQLATCSFLPMTGEKPQRGDLVVLP